jgi:CBS domain-containing protein
MHVLGGTPAPIATPPRSFETLREVVATVGTSLPVPATHVDLMRAARLHCQRGGSERTGSECLACSRIVLIKPSPGRSSVTVRCLWTDDDPIASVMTRPQAIVSVPPTLDAARAVELAKEQRAHHLLVVDGDRAVATVRCARLAEVGTVGAAAEPIWTIPLATSLGEASDAMARLGVEVLVVTEDTLVLGLLTVQDLSGCA